MTARVKARWVCGVGVAAIAVVLMVVLLGTPQRVAATNAATVAGEMGAFSSHTVVCQTDERIPAGTDALRLSVIADIGPAVAVTVTDASGVVARGRHTGGWVGGSLTFALQPALTSAIGPATICLTRDNGERAAELLGSLAPRPLRATDDGVALAGRMRAEYLRPGDQSWLSMALHVARRLGLGHSPAGTWVAALLAAVMVLVVALVVWLLQREFGYE